MAVPRTLGNMRSFEQFEDRVNMLCACIDNVCIRSLQKWNYENEESDKRIGIALYLFGVDCANYYGLD